jgi:hypothetical protein
VTSDDVNAVGGLGGAAKVVASTILDGTLVPTEFEADTRK